MRLDVKQVWGRVAAVVVATVLLGGGFLALSATAAVPETETETETVSVGDFDQQGLDPIVLATFEAGGSDTLYSAAGSRWAASGSMIEGDAELADGSSVVRVMSPRADGSLLRLNDDGPLALRDFFADTGAGSDLTVWFWTAEGTVSIAATDTHSVGGGYVNFNVPAAGRSVVSGVEAGDRFVLALTRPSADPEPETNPEPRPNPSLPTSPSALAGRRTAWPRATTPTRPARPRTRSRSASA